MDKRIVLAVAGSGKTTTIVNSLSINSKTLIITFTQNNYNNLFKKILARFNGYWPVNVTLFTYFAFLYSFCYKPYLADKLRIKGIDFDSVPPMFANQNQEAYYLTKNKLFYKNRISWFLLREVIEEIKERVCKYFDCLVVDEIQDFDCWDFDFLMQISSVDRSMLFVGDFYQHTFSTSNDGKKNRGLFDDYFKYVKRFEEAGFIIDSASLSGSWRCGKNICNYVTSNLGIKINSNTTDCASNVFFIDSYNDAEALFADTSLMKLHYQKSSEYGSNHINWGDSKGIDDFEDVCILLNSRTMEFYSYGKLDQLANLTLKKLYVAITRAHRNVYLVDEKYFLNYLKKKNNK